MAFSVVRGGLFFSSASSSAPRPRQAPQSTRLQVVSSRHQRQSGWQGAGADAWPRSCSTVRARAGGRGGGLMDAPTIERTERPGTDRSNEREMKRPPIYKVMLHNDNYNRREYVVKVLLKVVQGLGVDDAVMAMQEAHETGVSMVIACPQEDAEQYCEGLRLNGLTSTIEPTR